MRNKVWVFIGNLGILPAILLAVFVAPIFGEAKWPDIQWGFSSPDFDTLWSDYTVFGLGFPALTFFLSAIPAVFATYLVVFGDVLKTKRCFLNPMRSGKMKKWTIIQTEPI